MKCEGKAEYVGTNGLAMSMKGTVEIPEDSLKTLTANGSISFENLNVNVVKLKGKIRGGELKANDVSISGRVELSTIEGNNVVLLLTKENKIGQITCKTLNISVDSDDLEAKKKLLSLVDGFFKTNLSNDSKTGVDLSSETVIKIGKIVSDKITIFGCTVDEIDCDSITANDCKVKTIKYRGTCNISDDCSVDNIVKEG